MTPFFVAILLLGLSTLATAANFTQVFKWPDGLVYEWPSEEIRTQALGGETFKPQNIKPRFMAVYGERIFLSLNKEYGVPATLVSFPTSNASSSPPKLTPFPSWDTYLNESGSCNKIDRAVGLQVDSVGRLWVLNVGNSNGKLCIFNLKTNEVELTHHFSLYGTLHDLVIDETANGTLAYITRWTEQYIIVFSLERNESWIVDTPGMDAYSIALSPKNEPRQLYFSTFHSKELYSIPVAALRNGTRTANAELIGKWTGKPFRMVMDNHGTMYVAFVWDNYISSWNTSQPFEEQRFYQVSGLDFFWPFTLSLDQNGAFWVMVPYDERKPRLLKAAVGAKSFEDSPESSNSCQKNETA